MYDGLEPAAALAKMRQIFTSVRNPAVPPRMQDVLYKILVSGFAIGAVKKRGEDSLCHGCGERGADGTWKGVCESVEHTYAECEPVAALLAYVW